MDIFSIIGMGIIGCLLAVTVKQVKPEMAIIISLATAVGILIFSLLHIASLTGVINNIINRLNINTMYMNVVWKVVGISYIAEFASDICRDVGESAIAAKVLFAGKIAIAALTLPVMISVMDLIMGLLG